MSMGGRKSSGQVSRKDRGEQLLDVALALIVKAGYEGLTMAAVAQAAGVSRPIVYRSYSNRDALLVALLHREQALTESRLDEIVPRDPGDRHPREVLVDAITGILDAVGEHPLTWRLALLPPVGTPRLVHELVERRRGLLIRRARRLVRWGLPYLEAGNDLDVDVLARVLVSAVQEQARILLTDPQVERKRLRSSSEALISAVAWAADDARASRGKPRPR